MNEQTHFLLDNSMLETFQQCPRQFYYKYLRKRCAEGQRPSLNFGTAVHRALRYRYRFAEVPSERDTRIMQRIVERHLRIHPQPADDHRDAVLCQAIVERYNERYPKEEWQVLKTNRGAFVEFSFAIPLRERGFVYCGRIDLAVREPDGTIWIVDHKTTFQLGTSFFTEKLNSGQLKGYCWAFWKATGTRPVGAILNAIRVRPPARTRQPVEDDDFERQRTYLSEESLVEWEENAIQVADSIRRAQYYPMHTSWCFGKYGRCEYWDVCSLPKEQREAVLQSGLYRDNDWTPLNPIRS